VRFIDQFSVLLFDLHGPLLFDQDRFGDNEDYHATYRALGGVSLDSAAVRASIESCLQGLTRDYNAESKYDDFPTLTEAFRTHTDVSDEDLPLLEAVFAEHERGRLSPTYADLLRRLAETHQLGVVSNICARPDAWIAAFESAGVKHLFKSMVFSSDGRSIKPSRLIFHRALAAFDSDARVLFVGDSLERDIRPARALGLGTAWIVPNGSSHPAADVVVSSALELEHVS